MRVPGSPKPRTASPNRPQRQHLRPLLLANRARTTITLPKPTFHRAVISSPSNYKMTKSAVDHSKQIFGSGSSIPTKPNPAIDPKPQADDAIPEIKVTPPVQNPNPTGDPSSASGAPLAGFQVPERSSSLGATETPHLPATRNKPGEEDPRFLAPHYVPPCPPIPPRNSPWHTKPCPVYVPRPVIPLAPHSARRAGHSWDINFMPTTLQPGSQQPITDLSRKGIADHHNEEIGQAL
ncbi:hypothetical protein CspeluHIS016_0302710 [Cutaneotrichosporon spelunceum]|uniref:Uncharacterized protein n=1 Tax=Cutaneotrichosporon spelunceum TaxID=1672016 RepID=A0AAD3TTX7_9TREE|nr:hypothetical protein CspeluHIS016_0302710 [Cutaneotrichosporon spelunceum]